VIRTILVILSVAVLSGCSLVVTKYDDNAPAANKESQTVGGYYFGYLINGAKGIQIFDDRSTTYLQLPPNTYVDSVWMYDGSDKLPQFYDVEGSLIKIPRVSMKVVVLTNSGLFVAQRQSPLPEKSVNKKLRDEILLSKIRELLAEINMIKARMVARLERLK
jgi:uncharacterized protein YceK